MTGCKGQKLLFQELGSKRVEGKFDGGRLSSDGGLLLVRDLMKGQRFFERVSGCFIDHRKGKAVKHSVISMLKQRIYGLVAGYEDLNDHDRLRKDAVMSLMSEQLPDEELASHSTLNRLELTKSSVSSGERYKKVVCDDERLEHFFIKEFIRYAKRKRLKRLVLDADATDIPLHGKQEDRFYHGYYGHYCYLPLYIFCEDFPLWAQLRPSNIDASLGTKEALEVILPLLKAALPKAQIVLRADSGFAREEIMHFCEENGIDFILGLARNSRLQAQIEVELQQAKQQFDTTKTATRNYKDFLYQTLKSTWSKERRVVAKAEVLEKGENPRFVVTSLQVPSAQIYEEWYCQRSDAENRIKEQFQLFADRTSCSVKRGNQIRLWLSTLAYLVLVLFKKFCLADTTLAKAEVNTIRVRLLKVAVKVTVSARRVYLSFSDSFPLQHIFKQALYATS